MHTLDGEKILQYFFGRRNKGWENKQEKELISFSGEEEPNLIPNVIIVSESISTNSEMKERLKAEELPAGTMLLTDFQTAGRGRQGKSFYSPKGMGLYFSILTRPGENQGNAILITTHAAVAVVRTIQELYEIELSIKWVNDLFYQGKKVCGILAEGKFQSNSEIYNGWGNSSKWPVSSLEYCIMGIGLNLFTPAEGYPEEIKSIAGSLFGKFDDAKHADFDRNKLVATILYHYFSICKEEEVLKEYCVKNLVLDKTVCFMENGVEVHGRVIEISSKGELRVKLEDGEEKLVFSGEVHFL